MFITNKTIQLVLKLQKRPLVRNYKVLDLMQKFWLNWMETFWKQ